MRFSFQRQACVARAVYHRSETEGQVAILKCFSPTRSCSRAVSKPMCHVTCIMLNKPSWKRHLIGFHDDTLDFFEYLPL